MKTLDTVKSGFQVKIVGIRYLDKENQNFLDSIDIFPGQNILVLENFWFFRLKFQVGENVYTITKKAAKNISIAL